MSLFSKKKKAEKKQEIKSHIETHKELVINLVYIYGEHNTCTMAYQVDCDDAAGFDPLKRSIIENLGTNYIFETKNGAINLKYFCSVTFKEKEISEVVIDD